MLLPINLKLDNGTIWTKIAGVDLSYHRSNERWVAEQDIQGLLDSIEDTVQRTMSKH